jgi:tRNA (adenine22-N1)-methyltransferase
MKSLRLLAASKYIKGYNFLADCGTDHAKLPIFCVGQGLVKKAIASDNKTGPIKNAKKSIDKANLNDLVLPILADGLTYLDQEIDVVSILGMGGRLIIQILEDADLTYVKRLILSANSENYLLRDFLQNNNWMIENEELIKENGKYYQLMVLSKGKMNLNELEKEFGPLIIKSKSPEFIEMVNKLLLKLLSAYNKAKTEEARLEINERIKLLEEVIS